MSLNKFEEDGYTYFQLHAPCLVCGEQGRGTPFVFWKHGDDNCNGDIYVGDNACLKCKKCGRSAHVTHCGFSCPDHCDSFGYFVKMSSALSCTGILWRTGYMVTETGLPWLQRFLANIGEW